MERLSSTTLIPDNVVGPGYAPDDIGVGIVHIGFGSFHRAHQALYTDDAIASQGGAWRITGVSLRSNAIANNINPQTGRYSVLIRGNTKATLRVIGSVRQVIAINDASTKRVISERMQSMFDELTNANTRIVTLTVTEKAYGFDRTNGGVQDTNDTIKHDLNHPHEPIGVIGILVEALRRRLEAKVAPFTVLCCDNLPSNGQLLKSGVVDFARRINTDLANFIEQQVSFPCSMVDRITPATTTDTLQEVKNRLGAVDQAAVETEPFSQWVIEDNFSGGRPAWEAGGAVFVNNVEPYETMKLCMLNGTHSLIAYSGHLAGLRYVRDAMDSDDMLQWVRFHLNCSAKTLQPLPGMDYKTYANDLVQRFSNRSIAHETYQIAMDGTEKLPQRIFSPACLALQSNQSIESFAFVTAAWMRYCTSVDEQGQTFELQDPRADDISNAIKNVPLSAESLYKAITSLPGLFPDELINYSHWEKNVIRYLDIMLNQSMRSALACIPGNL